MDSESASERPSDGTATAGETDTSFTSNGSSEQSAAEVADLLLELVGHKAERKLNHLRRTFRGSLPHNPHLIEVAKLSAFPNHLELQWKTANEEAQKQVDRLSHHHKWPANFVQGSFTQDFAHENVGRVWVPFDPENPNIGEERYVYTKHHKLTEQIIRIIQDQIEATRKLFDTMTSHPDRFTTAAMLGGEGLREERQAHATFALRLEGIEVCEWCEDAERWEVYFEYPAVKTGEYSRRPGWNGTVAARR